MIVFYGSKCLQKINTVNSVVDSVHSQQANSFHNKLGVRFHVGTQRKNTMGLCLVCYSDSSYSDQAIEEKS